MALMERVQHLKISLEEIKLATNNFSDENLIGRGGFGKVYIGQLALSGQQSTVAIKRLDRKFGQGAHEFLKEIQMLSRCKHTNLISLFRFCDENGEYILVYEHAKHGSLDNYLKAFNKLSWMQRLRISVGAAHGFKYLHNDVDPHQRVLHCDIKSSNILLDENWDAKISDFGLSVLGPSNVEDTFVVANPVGTLGYVDPQYVNTGILTKESDVYSFGVVLFEILCGRPTIINQYHDERRLLAPLAQRHYEENKLNEIVHPDLMNQMKVDSLKVFSMVAYQCLKENRSERPTMSLIVEELEKALKLQACSKVAGFIRVGTCGKQSGVHHNQWSFDLEKDHKLLKIAIDHGEVIYSLMFTTESSGVSYTSKVGGWDGGDMISELIFDNDEEMIGITGTTSTRDGCTIISSLSFETTKRTHGPFGRATETGFSIPWDDGYVVGFYGIASNFINSIGVYVKAYEEIIKVGSWGKSQRGGRQHIWYLQLDRNHHLKKIIIDHGKVIYSLQFSTEYGGVISDYYKSGGWNGGETVTEVTLDTDEEINAINGTVASSRGASMISSISFVTNKKKHGPFGQVSGTPFAVSWDIGSFSGFYGLADNKSEQFTASCFYAPFLSANQMVHVFMLNLPSYLKDATAYREVIYVQIN